MRKLIDFHYFKECIVVCVVSLEEVNITPGNIPYQYCREIRTEGIGASKQLDYIIIPASAAIVATVIIAVIIHCMPQNQPNKPKRKNIYAYLLDMQVNDRQQLAAD